MVINIKRISAKRILFVLSIMLILTIVVSIVAGGCHKNEIQHSGEQTIPQDDITSIKLPEKPEKKSDGKNFFSEYRLERERVRGKQVEMLREIINNQTSEKTVREAASMRLVQITEDMEKEMKAENLVRSKGFDECVIIIQPGATTVIVQTSTLRLDKEEEIKKLVSQATQCNEETLCLIVREPEL